MMKGKWYFLILYLMALSLVPCGDGGMGIVEIANHLFDLEHVHGTDHDQHSNACTDDGCSPFCICSCCSIALDIPTKTPLQIELPLPNPGKQPNFSAHLLHSNYISNIWQPPKPA